MVQLHKKSWKTPTKNRTTPKPCHIKLPKTVQPPKRCAAYADKPIYTDDNTDLFACGEYEHRYTAQTVLSNFIKHINSLATTTSPRRKQSTESTENQRSDFAYRLFLQRKPASTFWQESWKLWLKKSLWSMAWNKSLWSTCRVMRPEFKYRKSLLCSIVLL